jgi:hypothetical protein
VTVEVFQANRAVTTVSSGGTDAPAQGTQETWTVASSSGFPAASSAASPPTQFHVADPAAPAEMIAVTGVSGTTWTVTRGAESTTPAAHTAGFTVYQVVTTGGLGQFLQSARNLADAGSAPQSRLNLGAAAGLQLVYLDDYDPDPTGATFSDTAMAAAQTAGGAGPYLIAAGAGAYKFAGSYRFIRNQGLVAAGSPFTTFTYTGDSVFIDALDETWNSASSAGGRFGGFLVNGSGAGASAVGMRWGDLLRGRCSDITISSFTGASAIGLYLSNVSGWSEEAEWTAINVGNCTTNVYFNNGSFDYSSYQLVIEAESGQDGIRMENGASLEGVRLQLFGNFLTGADNTAAVIAMDRLNPGTGSSRIDNSFIDIAVEPDGTTGTGHYTVLMLGGSSSQFTGTGVLQFLAPGGGNQPFQAGTFTHQFGFSGVVNEPGLGYLSGGDASAFQGGTQWAAAGDLGTGNGLQIYTQFADVQAFQLGNGANGTVAFYGNLDRSRKIDLLIAQPSSGAAGTLTWPGSVVWPRGASAPALATANGAVDRVRLLYLASSSTWYAELLTPPVVINSSASAIQPVGVQAAGANGEAADAAHGHPWSYAEPLASGEAPIARLWANQGQSLAAGTLALTYWSALKTESCSHIDTVVLATNASGLTYAAIGIYSVDGSGDITLLESTGDLHSSLWNSGTFTPYTSSLTSAFSKAAGTAYAIGFLAVGTTPPQMAGAQYLIYPSSYAYPAPQLFGKVTGQSTLPGSVSVGSISLANAGIAAIVRP